VNATVTRQALAAFIQSKLPTMPGARPKPPVGQPPLAEIYPLMRAVAISGIARSARFDDHALLPLLDFQSPKAPTMKSTSRLAHLQPDLQFCRALAW
jgi:hypothetical protein